MNAPITDRAMLGSSGYARNERDLYQTIDLPVTHALCRTLLNQRLASPAWTVWEPACGEWHMGGVLEEHFRKVIGSDIKPLVPQGIEADFLNSTIKAPFDAIITNPPFGSMIDQFVARGLQHIRGKRAKLVALLGRHELDCGVKRTKFFGACPEFAGKLVLTWRPRWIEESDGSPRHNYAWYIWTDAQAVTCAGGAKIFYAHKR